MSKFTKKNKEHLDSMVIGQGHTIMAGYIPEAVGAKAFSENYYKWKILHRIPLLNLDFGEGI